MAARRPAAGATVDLGWLSLGWRAGLLAANRSDARQHPGSRHPRLAELGRTIAALPSFVTAPMQRRAHLRWGATDAEVRAAMPGDELLPEAHFVATRAITIDAPPEAVWPWLVQVGYGRGGFYSYDLIDSLGKPSTEELLPQWQHLDVGDVIAPMTRRPSPATSFTLAASEHPHSMVWVKPDSTWSWRLDHRADHSTRLVTRLKQRYALRPSTLVTVPLLELGDFPMMCRMLQGIKRRAESPPSRPDRSAVLSAGSPPRPRAGGAPVCG